MKTFQPNPLIRNGPKTKTAPIREVGLIDVKTLADRAFMSESTAERCLEAWNACVSALIEVGRLPDPAKAATQKKAAPKPKPATVEAPAKAETPPA